MTPEVEKESTATTTTPARIDVRFSSGSDDCHAWLYLPGAASASGPVPVIVMAHGFSGVKQMRLDAFAERFCAAGYACLVFDYRHFGESNGQPRELMDIGRQLEDWRNAVTFARSRPELDPERVIVWGTSFAGGHAIGTAAEDPRIAAAIAQCPFTDGTASILKIPPMTAVKLMALGLRDVVAAWRGQEPVRVPVNGQPGQVAVMTAPDAVRGFDAIVEASGLTDVPQLVPARIALHVPLHIPGRRAKDVRCPILFAVCERDSVAPAWAAVKYAARAPRGEIRLYDAGHFDIYLGTYFEQFLADQIDFLNTHVPVTAGSSSSTTSSLNDTMKYDIGGRTVAITGASGGLGQALAEALRARKANLVLLDLDANAVAEQAERLGGPRVARGWRADVRDLGSLEAAMREASEHFGRLDVVIAGAGIGGVQSMGATEPEAWERAIDINLNGVWRTFKAAAPYVQEQRGHLMAIASMASFVHSPLQSSYTASKAGVWALCDSLRMELQHLGVTVGSVHPTFFKTPMVDDALANPAALRLFNNFEGLFELIPLETVVDDIVRGIERRSAHVVSPRKLRVAALAPGLLRLVTDRISFPGTTVSDAIQLAAPAKPVTP